MTCCTLGRIAVAQTIRTLFQPTFALLLCLTAMIAAADTIHPGIVIDRERGVVYASDRGGLAHALSIEDGTSLWRTSVNAYPLGVLDGRLVALGAPETPGEAVILALDPADGRLLDRIDVALMPGVVAQFRPLPRRQFEVHAVATGETLEVHWEHRRQPLRGALLADDDGRPVVEAPDAHQQHGSLTIRFDNDDLSVRAADGTVEAIPFAANPTSPENRLPGSEGKQWLASDEGSLAIVSEIEDVTFGTTHRFAVHAPDGTRLGAFDSPHAWLPFVTHAGLVLYRVDPVMVDSPETGRVAHGSRLIAHDLATGGNRWSFDVIERRYFGPLPP